MSAAYLKYDAWERELLQGDPDRNYLLNGIKNGFDIIDPNSEIKSAKTKNYRSATCPENRPIVEAMIRREINEGRYVKVSKPPVLISALGAVEKPDSSDLRLIHDGSMPRGEALNDYAFDVEKLKYQTVQEATELITPNGYLAKVDLKSAYRSVKISEKSRRATGLEWTFVGDSEPTFMYDGALPFGSKLSPWIFTKLTQAVRRMMLAKGFRIVCYLDDMLIVEKTKERCELALQTLLQLLRQLGFAISYSKVVTPTRKLCFLGIDICTETLTLSLPKNKVDKFMDMLCVFQARKRASLRQLQQLAGRLNWASQVVQGGRTYLRRVLDLMRPLREPHHKVLLGTSFQADVQWWISYLQCFNSRSLLWCQAPVQHVNLDASSVAGGYYYNGDWGLTMWEYDSPAAKELHINDKEIFAGVLAARRWAHLWTNSVVFFHTDNMTARAAFDKGTVRSESGMVMLRELFWLSAKFNFKVVGVFIPGVVNHLPDAITRLHQPGYPLVLASEMGYSTQDFRHFASTFPEHMSLNCIISLTSQIRKYSDSWTS